MSHRTLDDLEDQIPEDMKAAAKQRAATPQPATPRMDFNPDADQAIYKAVKARQQAIANLRSRKLDREIKLLDQFTALGCSRARVRASSLQDARSYRSKLYFARAQEMARINQLPSEEERLAAQPRVDSFFQVAISVGEDIKGHFVELTLMADRELEPIE